MEDIKWFAEKFRAVVASRLFFWLTIGFFVLESAWIALSARYPQAFDEQFHFGIIQVYSHHWLPFLKSQPPNADPYGAVARDPSFLFHYLMSFPYRIVELFTHDQTIQIIDLRFIDIAMFALGLVLFREVLRKAKMSNMAINTSIFITALIPVAPQLAGQINYDNLLIPLTAWACLLTFNIIDQLEKRRFTIQAVFGLVAVCLLSSMVKYEFMPIFLAIAAFLAVFAWNRLKGHWRSAWQRAVKDWKKGNAGKWLLALLLLVTVCLFVERDVGNVIMYHTIIPNCSEVLDTQSCSAYSVWIHDYESHKTVVGHVVNVDPNPIKYIGEWAYWLWYRLFFAINGPDSGFQNYPPLPLPAGAFVLIIVISTIALIMHGRKTLTDRPYLKLLGVIVIIYLLTLFGDGYIKFLDTDVLELMNGRYLFPILLPGVAVAFSALRELTRNWSNNVRYSITFVVLICFMQGGGVFTFVSRSDQSWYWNNTAVVHMNNAAKKILGPITFDGPEYYSSSKWFFN